MSLIYFTAQEEHQESPRRIGKPLHVASKPCHGSFGCLLLVFNSGVGLLIQHSQTIDIPGLGVAQQEYYPYVNFSIDLARLFAAV